MTSKKETIARLSHMIVTLRSVDPNFFDLRDWYDERKELGECGTYMCACGFEALTEYANDRGFRMGIDGTCGWVEFGDLDHPSTGWHAISDYFGLNIYYIQFLFDRNQYPYYKGWKSIRDVIERIEYTLHLLRDHKRSSIFFDPSKIDVLDRFLQWKNI